MSFFDWRTPPMRIVSEKQINDELVGSTVVSLTTQEVVMQKPDGTFVAYVVSSNDWSIDIDLG